MFLEKLPQHAFHFIVSKSLISRSQIPHQHIRVMLDRTQVIPVFVITGAV